MTKFECKSPGEKVLGIDTTCIAKDKYGSEKPKFIEIVELFDIRCTQEFCTIITYVPFIIRDKTFTSKVRNKHTEKVHDKIKWHVAHWRALILGYETTGMIGLLCETNA